MSGTEIEITHHNLYRCNCKILANILKFRNYLPLGFIFQRFFCVFSGTFENSVLFIYRIN